MQKDGKIKADFIFLCISLIILNPRSRSRFAQRLLPLALVKLSGCKTKNKIGRSRFK